MAARTLAPLTNFPRSAALIKVLIVKDVVLISKTGKNIAHLSAKLTAFTISRQYASVLDSGSEMSNKKDKYYLAEAFIQIATLSRLFTVALLNLQHEAIRASD